MSWTFKGYPVNLTTWIWFRICEKRYFECWYNQIVYETVVAYKNRAQVVSFFHLNLNNTIRCYLFDLFPNLSIYTRFTSKTKSQHVNVFTRGSLHNPIHPVSASSIFRVPAVLPAIVSITVNGNLMWIIRDCCCRWSRNVRNRWRRSTRVSHEGGAEGDRAVNRAASAYRWHRFLISFNSNISGTCQLVGWSGIGAWLSFYVDARTVRRERNTDRVNQFAHHEAPLIAIRSTHEGEDISHRNRWLCASLRSVFPQEPRDSMGTGTDRKVLEVECLNRFRETMGRR